MRLALSASPSTPSNSCLFRTGRQCQSFSASIKRHAVSGGLKLRRIKDTINTIRHLLPVHASTLCFNFFPTANFAPITGWL